MVRRKKIRIKDIAKELGVSYATVSQALNHPREVGRATVKNVMAKCQELGYAKKVSTSKRKGVIGIIAQDIYNLVLGEYYNHIFHGVLEETQKRGLRIETEFLPEGAAPLMVSKNSVDGVLLFGKISAELALMLKQKGIPTILVGHPIANLELHTVMADGRAGIYEATKHLMQLGHKKIAMVYSAPIQDYITADRIAGYRFALTEAGIKLNEEYLVEANWCHPISACEATFKLLDLKEAPTAIIYMNDTMAYRAYKAFAERKLKIPRDISVVGFDGMTFPNYIDPPKPSITTVAVNLKLIGKTALNILLDQIEKPSEIAVRYTLPVELKIKASTGTPG